MLLCSTWRNQCAIPDTIAHETGVTCAVAFFVVDPSTRGVLIAEAVVLSITGVLGLAELAIANKALGASAVGNSRTSLLTNSVLIARVGFSAVAQVGFSALKAIARVTTLAFACVVRKSSLDTKGF
jgi:hypothetical protein